MLNRSLAINWLHSIQQRTHPIYWNFNLPDENALCSAAWTENRWIFGRCASQMYKYFDSNWTQRNVDTLALTKRIDANQIHEQPFPTNNICARQLCPSMHAHTHVRARSERDERHKRYIHTLTTTHKASTHPSTSIARGKHAHTRTRRNHRSKIPPTTKLNKLNLISSTCHKSIKCRHLYVWKQWQISLYVHTIVCPPRFTYIPAAVAASITSTHM